jgi:hypothetical protein
MVTFLKIISFLWPFLKEVILGDRTIREALRHHVGRILLIGLILLSVGLNFLTVPKLLSISYEYIELKRKYEQLSKARGVDPPAQPPALRPEQPTETAAPQVPHDSYHSTKEFYERLRKREKR